MARSIDCQSAIVSWGTKAIFRRSRVGLFRKNSTVYLVVFFSSTDNQKFPIEPQSVEILPAAIRFKELGKDLFIRRVSDEQLFANMRREIKILLNKNRYMHSPKAETLERFISSIPPFTDFKKRDLLPPKHQLSVSLIGRVVGSAASGGIDEEQQFMDIDSIGFDNQPINNEQQSQVGDYDDSRIALKQNYTSLTNKQLRSIKIIGLEKVPKQLWQRASLHQLTLSNCNLTNVPKQLETFANTLNFLDLSCNIIDKLPRSFCCKMNKLTFLNLSNNQIETLPFEIKFFCRLSELNISHNKLRMLPSTFSDLKRLRTLNVANNSLSQLPAFRRTEIMLNDLDVSYNPLDGALNGANTFEVHPSIDGPLEYNENLFCPLSPVSNNKFLTLFEISILNIVRCDRLLKLASEESLPRTIVSTMQRDIFKCYKCSLMNILPAYNSTDTLDYVNQVKLKTTGNYRHGMTFMKLLCRSCFDNICS